MAPVVIARQMWTLFEPIHAVTYFSPPARAAFEDAGLRGFWRGYFAGRAAPLGAVDAAPVIAAFYFFAPTMVTRALPDVWSRATPQAALQARLEGACAALKDVEVPRDDLLEAADLAAEVASYVDPTGHVLGAANAALPMPEDPLARLWQATTVLREHRGDGHVAALVTADLDGCEAVVLRSTLDGSRANLQANRGWTDEECGAAGDRLRGRGLLDAEDVITSAGRQVFAAAEAATDVLAERPWRRLGQPATDRLAALVLPIARSAGALLPEHNPIGVPKPA